ncbi:MAG TPA: YihY/virulence factor BrkB family protein, partial [Planctomycetota bacterium]|nr:YihY/virulence factor BrkB family protein [Planctomycetota bacterium]
MRASVARALAWLERDLWRDALEDMSPWRRAGVGTARTAYLALRSLFHHDAPTRAAALTYATILAMVPAFALTIAIAKGLGAYEPLMDGVVSPTLDRVFESGTAGGRQMREALDRVLQLVERTDVTSLGLFGLLLLALTAVGLLVRVEGALNAIWEVERPRHVLRRLVDFSVVLLVSPVLAIVGTLVRSFTPLARQVEGWSEALHVRPALDAAVSAAPVAFLWIGFATLYRLMPHTRVRLRAALFGGAVATLLWLGVQGLYVDSQASVARLSRLYASFAAAPLFLLWVYASWLVVLFGAAFGYAHQHLRSHRRLTRAWSATPAQLEALGLRLA